jgi:hypothetical protein
MASPHHAIPFTLMDHIRACLCIPPLPFFSYRSRRARSSSTSSSLASSDDFPQDARHSLLQNFDQDDDAAAWGSDALSLRSHFGASGASSRTPNRRALGRGWIWGLFAGRKRVEDEIPGEDYAYDEGSALVGGDEGGLGNEEERQGGPTRSTRGLEFDRSPRLEGLAVPGEILTISSIDEDFGGFQSGTERPAASLLPHQRLPPLTSTSPPSSSPTAKPTPLNPSPPSTAQSSPSPHSPPSPPPSSPPPIPLPILLDDPHPFTEDNYLPGHFFSTSTLPSPSHLSSASPVPPPPPEEDEADFGSEYASRRPRARPYPSSSSSASSRRGLYMLKSDSTGGGSRAGETTVSTSGSVGEGQSRLFFSNL